MNFGTQDIQDIIYQQVKRAGYKGGIPHGKFAKDTAKLVYELIGDNDMSKKDWNLFHDFPQELEAVVKQLRVGFGWEPMKDDNAKEVYTWLKEQGRDKIAVFIRWATDTERVQYAGKYRKSPGLIKTEWKLAFKEQQTTFTRNDDGSINV